MKEGEKASKMYVICEGEVSIINTVNPFGDVWKSKEEILINEEDDLLN